MKKVLVLVVCCFALGCTSESLDTTKRAEDIIALLKEDNINNIMIAEGSKTDDMSIVLENEYCQINIELDKEKITKLTSSLIDKNTKDYSCVFRTIFKDKDLVGADPARFADFMVKFREGKDFNFDNLAIKNNGLEMSVEVK